MNYSAIRGFNYQPSYGSCGLELWQKFDAAVMESELKRGKRHFPGMNAIRLWLSWDAFLRDPQRFSANFDAALGIAGRLDLPVMPVLFNRWHSDSLDYGGIYIDHFLPGACWTRYEKQFQTFLECIIGPHAADPRVFAWDLCNEPFFYPDSANVGAEIIAAEFKWLESLHAACKRLNARAPVTVGIHPGHGRRGIEQIEPISDLLSIHPYWTGTTHDKAAYEKQLDDYVAFAEKVRKPLLATETCWGAIDDRERVAIIRYTLTQLKQRGIGWLAYLLHHSLIADAHRPEFGPVGSPGNLAFIEADGALRPGHEAFNEF